MSDSRITRESSRLIQSLDSSARYILFERVDEGKFAAAICSQVSDKVLCYVGSGDGTWTFDDKDLAVRSLRRLNKDVQIYTGHFYSFS